MRPYGQARVYAKGLRTAKPFGKPPRVTWVPTKNHKRERVEWIKLARQQEEL
jgi:hypothetical protein